MYRALLVCNSTYPEDPARFPPLNGPQVDGLRLWAALTDTQTGFFDASAVSVLYERTQKEVLEAAERFFAAARAPDTVLFYFTGHAYPANTSLYLCARDTVAQLLRSTGISTDELSKMIDGCDAAVVIVILDCCFSGAFKGIAAPNLGGEGRYVITATTPQSLANDAAEQGLPSPFTAALIESLSSGAIAHDQSEEIDLDDLFRDLEERIPEDGPRPERDFDGSGRVPIARRQRSDLANGQIHSDDMNAISLTDTGAEGPESLFSRLVTSPRKHGDLTIADIAGWKACLLLGVAAVAFGLWLSADIQNRDSTLGQNYYPEVLLALGAAIVGAFIILLALIEGWRLRKRKISSKSRRQVVEELSHRYPPWLRPIGWLTVLASVVVLMSPLTGRGFVTSAWIVCLACLAGFVLISLARYVGWGDDVLVAAAVLVAGGNFVPIYYDYDDIRSGVQTGFGLVWIILGLLQISAWYWRSPRPVLLALQVALVLSLIASASNVLVPNQPHWFLTLVAAVISSVGLFLGAGRLLPIQASTR